MAFSFGIRTELGPSCPGPNSDRIGCQINAVWRSKKRPGVDHLAAQNPDQALPCGFTRMKKPPSNTGEEKQSVSDHFCGVLPSASSGPTGKSVSGVYMRRRIYCPLPGRTVR